MRGFSILGLVLVVASGTAAGAAPEPLAAQSNEIVAGYLRAIQANGQAKDVSMAVEIDATLPKLKKQGKMYVLKVARSGETVYQGARFEGDDMIKKDVIARYLAAERQFQNGRAAALAITSRNYRFRFRGTANYQGEKAYVFRVTPKKRRLGLYAGELWIDPRTFLPLREWGELVKNPSVFIKNVYFVRDYLLRDGRALPRRIITSVDTRLVGKAELTIWFSNIALADHDPGAAKRKGPSAVRNDGRERNRTAGNSESSIRGFRSSMPPNPVLVTDQGGDQPGRRTRACLVALDNTAPGSVSTQEEGRCDSPTLLR